MATAKTTAAAAATHVDWPGIFAALAAGLGLTISGADFLGGMFMALTGSLVAWKMPVGPGDPRKLWLVIATGFLAAIVAAMMHPAAMEWLGITKLPVQASMMLAGFGSKWIVIFAYKFFERVGTKGGDVADRIVPGGDDK